MIFIFCALFFLSDNALAASGCAIYVLSLRWINCLFSFLCSIIFTACSDLMPASGLVYRQVCMFGDASMGSFATGLVGKHSTYWEYEPPSGSPFTGVFEIGVLNRAAGSAQRYDATTSCSLNGTANDYDSSTKKWIAQPHLRSTANIFADENMLMNSFGSGPEYFNLSCTLFRLRGADCHRQFDILDQALRQTVPKQSIPVDPKVACA